MRSPTTLRQDRGKRRCSVLLIAMAAVLAVWWGALVLVLAVDPLNLYSWGVAPKLADSGYPPEATPYLIDVVAKDPAVDTVLIGGSTSVAFRRDLMKEELAGTGNAFNVSYSAVRAGDRALVSERLLASTSLRRVLIAVDWIYALQGPLNSEPSFPAYLYDRSPFNDARMIGLDTVNLAVDAVSHHPLGLSDWSWPAYEASRKKLYSRFQTPEQMLRLRDAIGRYRAEVATPTTLTCADLDAVNRQLLPFVRALSVKKIEIDLFFPPYSYAAYYDWLATPQRRAIVGAGFLEDQLLLRRCLVDAVAAMPGTRVFAFDNETWLAGDLQNYSDTTHLLNENAFRYMLQQIATGSHQLTRENVSGEAALLRQRVAGYEFKNSNFGGSHGLEN